MRAVRHDRDTAIAMGIPAQRVYIVTFAIGFALAGFGGVVAAPITTVDFRGGVDLLPVCFIAVIIGGLGQSSRHRGRGHPAFAAGGNYPERGEPDRRSHFLAGADERRSAVAAARPVQRSRPVTSRIGHRAVRAGDVRRLHAVSAMAGAGAGQLLLGQRDRGNPDLVAVRRERQSAVRLCRAAVVRPGAVFWLRHVRCRHRHRSAPPVVLAGIRARHFGRDG